MQNLNIGTKTSDGGASAAGQLTADDVNKIVQKVNQLVSVKVEESDIIDKLNESVIILDENQFEGEGTPTNKIRLSQSFIDTIISTAINTGSGNSAFNGEFIDLPDLNGKTYRYRSVNGSLSGTEIVVPEEPVTVVNDSANTLTWTEVAGYPAISEYEFTLNGAATWQPTTSKTIIVGDVKKGLNQVGVRVKMGPTGLPGKIGYNKAEFSVSLTTPDAPGGGIVDDTANTFTWIKNPAYPSFSDYELTLDGGQTLSAVNSLVVAVGQVIKAIDKVGVRVKAVPSVSNPSEWRWNKTAFSAPLITQPIPAGIVADDETNEINWTLASGKTLSDYEYTVDFGATYTDVIQKPITLQNQVYQPNQIGIRLKAVPDVSVYSDTLYYGSGMSVSIPTTLVPEANWAQLTNTHFVTPGANDGTTQLNEGFDFSNSITKMILKSGVVGIVEVDMEPSMHSAWIMLGADNLNHQSGATSYCAIMRGYNYLGNGNSWQAVSEVNKVAAQSGSGGPDGRIYGSDPGMITKLRIRSDGNYLYAEYYANGQWSLAKAGPGGQEHLEAKTPHTMDCRVKMWYERQLIDGNHKYPKSMHLRCSANFEVKQ